MTNSTADWVSVHYEDILHSEKQRKKGLTVRFMASPLDVPDMWRHGVRSTDDGGRELICDFKYLATKEPTKAFEKDGVKLSVGKNSRRVYQIAIPLPRHPQDGDEFELKIELAIQEKIQSLKDEAHLRPTHWDIIKGMLQRPNITGASHQPGLLHSPG
ncbi:MAG: hypothetical protein AB7E59_08830 [Pusillimonas sp.]